MADETVHSVYDYWDGPRTGAADFNGAPHWYQAVFDDAADEWSDVFDLTPLSHVAFEAEMQAHRVFQDWKAKFEAGLVGAESHPQTVRDPETVRLRALVKSELGSVPVAARMTGRFTFDREANRYVVEWSSES